MLVHCPGRLGAAIAIVAAELLGGDGVFTKEAPKRSNVARSIDRVISHSFNCSHLSRYNLELKLLSHQSRVKSTILWQQFLSG